MTRNSSQTPFIKASTPKRIAPFSLRLSAHERAEIERRADGMPIGAYIKSLVLSSPAGGRSRSHPVDRQELARVLSALGQSRLSQNMNQIAKAANLGTLPVTPETEQELKQACYDIACMQLMLMKALGKKPEGSS